MCHVSKINIVINIIYFLVFITHQVRLILGCLGREVHLYLFLHQISILEQDKNSKEKDPPKQRRINLLAYTKDRYKNEEDKVSTTWSFCRLQEKESLTDGSF